MSFRSLLPALLVLGLLSPLGLVAAEGAPPSQPAPGSSPSPASPPSPALGLGEAANHLQASLSWDPLTRTGKLEKAGLVVSFGVDLPWLLFDYGESVAAEPLLDSPKGTLMPASTLALLERRFSQAGTESSAKKGQFSIAAILIDPGHGGKDSGAVGEHLVGGKKLRVVEKDLALDVSTRIFKALKERFPDKKILISRDKDVYPTLEDRVAMANQVSLGAEEAIIYVSVHANASFNKNAKGYEVWYLNPEYRRTLVDPASAKKVGEDIAPILNAMLEEEFTTESIMLARKIMGGLQAGIGAKSPSRGIRAEEWFVVRNVRMPSVLVEMGFVTNPEEAALLGSDDYLKRLSDGIYTGIVDFVGYFETMRGPPTP